MAGSTVSSTTPASGSRRWGCLPPGAAALGHLGLGRRAGLDRHADLERGERRADENGTPQREELYGKAIEKYRRLIRETAERGIEPEQVAATIEHALSASRPRARYLVGREAKLAARAKQLIPTAIFDRVVARKMSL